MKLLSRPDIQLYITAVLVFFGGMLFVSNSAIDIHMQDTYGLFTDKSYLWACLLIGLEALIYTLTLRFRQFRWLQVLHVASLLLFFLAYATVEDPPMPRRYFDYYDRPFFFYGRVVHPAAFSTTLLLVIGQAGFIINIIAGVIRGRELPQAPDQPQPALQLYLIALLALAAGIACYFVPDLLPADLPVFPGIALAILIAAEAAVYLLTNSYRQLRWLQQLHVTSAFACAVLFPMVPYFIFLYNFPDIHTGAMFGMFIPVVVLWLAVLSFLVGQLAFTVNIIAGFFRGQKS